MLLVWQMAWTFGSIRTIMASCYSVKTCSGLSAFLYLKPPFSGASAAAAGLGGASCGVGGSSNFPFPTLETPRSCSPPTRHYYHDGFGGASCGLGSSNFPFPTLEETFPSCSSPTRHSCHGLAGACCGLGSSNYPFRTTETVLSCSSSRHYCHGPRPHLVCTATADAKTIESRGAAAEEGEEEKQKQIIPARSGFQALGNKEKKELRAYAHGLGTRLNVQQLLERGSAMLSQSPVEMLHKISLLHEQVGKLGVSQTVVNSISDALEANEILKVRVLENCVGTMDEVVKQLEWGTGGQVVGKIGRTVLLYRASLRKLAAVEKQPETPKYRNRKVMSAGQESRSQFAPRKAN